MLDQRNRHSGTLGLAIGQDAGGRHPGDVDGPVSDGKSIFEETVLGWSSCA